jgi:RNA polymerase sigma-70 factor (ECF subfamily)
MVESTAIRPGTSARDAVRAPAYAPPPGARDAHLSKPGDWRNLRFRELHSMGVPAVNALRARSDLDLAQRCVSGDRTAQRDFFQRERHRVHAILYRIVGSNADMEDLLQEAFIQIFRSMAGFRGEASLATWLDRIAVRVAYAYLSKRRNETVRLALVPEPISTEPSADQRMMTRESTRRLYGALDSLAVAQRVAFTLHVIDGRPLRDVAVSMSATVVATKVRVWRAWRALQQAAERDPLIADLLGTSTGKGTKVSDGSARGRE